jgi:hypothetical protein
MGNDAHILKVAMIAAKQHDGGVEIGMLKYGSQEDFKFLNFSESK